MKLLITGASGFLGTNVIEALRSGAYGNHEWLNLDIQPPKLPGHLPYWRQVDVRDEAALNRYALGFAPDVLVHLAARTDLSETAQLRGYDTNIAGVENVLAVAAKIPDLRAVVHASSRLVVDVDYQPRSDYDYSPSTLYGVSKVLGEVLVRTQHECVVPWVIVRPTSIWGPWFGVPYRDFFLNVTRGRYLHPRGRRPVKQFGYVGNAVHQLLRLSLAEDLTEINQQMFWLADYEPLDVLDWANEIRSQLRLPATREVGTRVLGAAARAGDLMQRTTGRAAPLTTFRLNNLTADMAYDTTGTEKMVGNVPHSVPEGVRLTLEWMQEHDLLPASRRGRSS